MANLVQAKWSATYTTAAWSFEWTSSKTANGQTTVSWSLYTKGRDYSPTELWGYCNLSVTYNGKTEQLANYSNNSYSFSNRFRTSGSFVVKHGDNGAGSFVVKMKGRIYENGEKSLEQTCSLDTNYPYTRCVSPTSVEIDKKRVAAGGQITVSWSSAENGQGGNKITKYLVWYRLGSGAWSDAYEANVVDGTTSGSKTITIPSTAAPGSEIQACVQAIGTISGYDASGYGYSESQTSWVNRKPSKPTITITIPSNGKGSDLTKIPAGGKRTLSVAPGGDDDSQTVIVTNSTSSTTAITRSIEVTGTVSYTFYSWDGVEYSEGTEVSFVANTSSPTVEGELTPSETLTSVNNTSGLNYVVKFTASARKGSNGQSSGNTYGFHLCVSNSANGNFVYEKTLQGGSQTSLSISDIRAHKNPGTSGYYYKILITRYDGIESDSWYSNAYYVTKLPKIIKASNDKTSAPDNITNSNSILYFSESVKLYLEPDDGYSHIILASRRSSGKISSTYPQFSLTKSGTEMCATAVLSDIMDRGDAYSIQYRLKNGSVDLGTQWFGPATGTGGVFPFYRINLPQFGQITGPVEINPYTVSGNKNWVTNNFLIMNSEYYGFNVLNDQISGNGCTVTAYYGSRNNQIDIVCQWVSASNLNFVISDQECKTLFSTLGISTLTKGVNVNLDFKLTNLYGNTITLPSSTTISYVTQDTEPTKSESDSDGLEIYYDSKEAAVCTEHCVIESKMTIKCYHRPSTCTAKLFGYQILISNLSTTWNEGAQVPQTVTCSFSVKVPQIFTDNKNPKMFVTIGTVADQAIKDMEISLGKEAVALKNGHGEITQYSLGEDKSNPQQDKLNLSCLFDTLGISSRKDERAKFTATVYYKTGDNYVCLSTKDDKDCHIYNGESVSETFSKATNTTFYLNPGLSTNGYLNLKIKCTTYILPTADANKQEKKVWWTPEIIVYKASPTLSYRKNKIGVNYTFPESEEIINPSLVIGAHDDSKYVYFYSAENQASIDLSSGKQKGFVYHIDCGTWE